MTRFGRMQRPARGAAPNPEPSPPPPPPEPASSITDHTGAELTDHTGAALEVT